jgi:drug/metabolite transporter (DMT)-like permease
MGIVASLLSAVLSSAKDLISKRLAVRLDGTASTFASFAYALPYYVALLTVLYFLGAETFTLTITFLVLVLLRAVTDTFAEGMKMYALAHGDISLVACFFSISPVFLLVTSPLITGDRPSLRGSAGVLLVVAGSLGLFYRPSTAAWKGQGKGVLLALGASVFFALNSCFDRLAVQQGTPAWAGFSMTLLSAAFLLPFVLGRKARLDAMHAQQGSLLTRGLLETLFMVSKLWALQYLPAPDVAGIQRVSLVVSIVGGRVFFGEPDFVRRLIVGVVILAGVLLIVWPRG